MNREYIMPILVVIFVIAVFAIGIGSNNLSAPAAVKRAQSITQDVSGTIWTCTWENEYYWKHVYGDGTIETIDEYINPQMINCDDSKDADGAYFYWSCENDNNLCDAANEGRTCTCRKQKSTDTGKGSSA